tara:strand:+ start:235 stop:480 length:246 start_codon:yes stop_codon:yes gene_type:complete
MNDQPEPLPVELLLSEDARRDRVTIDDHQAFHKSMAPEPIDDDDDTVLDPFEHRAGSRRSDREVKRLLSVLDNLDRKAPTQ